MKPLIIRRSIDLPRVAVKRAIARHCAKTAIPNSRRRTGFRALAAISKFAPLAFALASLGVVAGCQFAPGGRAVAPVAETAQYMTLEEFATALNNESGVTLVEFCIPDGCAHSDEMRDPIDRLASESRQGLTVRRMDLNQHLQLAWEFGFTECPTYIAFRHGEEVFRATYPTPVDLIASSLEQSLSGPSADQLSIAAQ